MMDFFSSTKFFYYASLVVNILFILISAYTLWRIESSNTASSKYIMNAAQMTQEALKAFTHWTGELKAGVAASARRDEGIGAKDASADQLRNALEAQKLLTELQKVAVSIEEMDTQRLQAMMSELDQVIESMVLPGAPDARSQTELMRLKGQRERLAGEVEQLQVRLDESAKVIADLRRENRASFTAGSSLDLLKQVNERLFAELKTMRDRMLAAEERSAELSRELIQVQSLVDDKAGVTTVPSKAAAPETSGEPVVPFSSANNTAKLQKRILELEADRANLLDQVQEAQQALSRSLREKAMIEERFLKLDEIAG